MTSKPISKDNWPVSPNEGGRDDVHPGMLQSVSLGEIKALSGLQGSLFQERR